MKFTAKAAASGALAGIAGSLAMHLFRRFWDSATNNAPEYGMFGFDREADIHAARLLNAVLFSRTTPEEEAEKLGLALHYLYGGGVGLSYAAFAARSSRLRGRGGMSFGAALWLLGDEIPVSLTGVSDPFKKTTPPTQPRWPPT
jgi:hypothetical protein